MKRFSFALCAWLFLAAPVLPQEDMVKVNQIVRKINDRIAKAREHGNVLTEIDALKALESEYARDEAAQGILRQMISQLLPQVGAYEEAHRYADLASGIESAAGPARIDGYTPVNALQALAAASGDRQIVMINEAHHVPQHRAFTLQLLGRLKEKGFRYFAAETLQNDPDLARRGYPTGKTGAYIPEPLYGDLVRMALRLGYTVVHYESETFDPKDPVKRERDQARHLVERILAKDPKARVLVHGGYSHMDERSDNPARKWMAAQLKEMTGIDPLTINQYWMTEHSAPEFEEPVYRWATGNGLVSEAVVFRNAAGDLWTLHAGFDVAVFHPRSRNEDGRPAWLRLGGLRSPLPLLVWVCGTAPRCLVTARSAAEGTDAIPLDRIVVEAGKPVPALLLPPGTYVIRVEDAQGKLIRENVQPSGGGADLLSGTLKPR